MAVPRPCRSPTAGSIVALCRALCWEYRRPLPGDDTKFVSQPRPCRLSYSSPGCVVSRHSQRPYFLCPLSRYNQLYCDTPTTRLPTCHDTTANPHSCHDTNDCIVTHYPPAQLHAQDCCVTIQFPLYRDPVGE